MNCSFRQIKATREGGGGYKWDFTVPLQVTQLTLREQLLSCTGTIDFPET